ncbi:sensor histidine kinase [Pedobacter ginsengisoli]|uniref:sensor histidine kinase n=1 Tax=Pedobacter ginsengisoli TaxID=363852 RepID=UPI00254A0A43|nr:PAS domain-containing protein [Pedobacter ginsengisoli]
MLTATIVLALLFLVVTYCLARNMAAVRRMKNEVAGLRKQNETLSARAELLGLAERISNLGTWELFPGSKTVRWSEELYNIYGFKDKCIELSAELNEQVIAPEYRDKVAKELRSAISNQTTFAVEYQIIQPDGTRRYVLGQGFYIEKDDKLVGTIQDITQQKDAIFKLKINETLLREAEMVSHSGSWEWVDGKEFVLWSDEMYNIHGFLPHSVFVNFAFYQGLVHEEDLHEFLKNFFKARENKAPFKINYRIVRPSGEVRHVLSTAEYKKIGLNNFAYIGNTQDVTELRKAQVQLEEKVTELNRSNQDLEQFAYVASHDLQEPLRKIQAFGDKLKDKYLAHLPPEALDYLERMRNAAERMRALINDLLTFSRATRDHKNFIATDLAELINGTIRELDFSIGISRAAIRVTVDLDADAIPSQLQQLFQNLIANALKFTDAEIPPEIEITGYAKYGHELSIAEARPNQLYSVIEIKDNGIGFEEEEAKKIFDIFHRLHSRNEYSGTGIGLAICKKIVENHSGFILANSEPGNGAVFTVILPKRQIK